jgi:hypothetical protein
VTRWRAATTLLSTPSAQASTMRARRANACAVLRRSVNATSCSRSDSLNTSCAFGLPLIVALVVFTPYTTEQATMISSTNF